MTLVMVVLSSLIIKFMSSITGAWEFIIECGAGLGLVLILRWYWWRINAWSEIVAMIVPILVYGMPRFIAYILHPGEIYKPFVRFPESLFFIAGITTISWVIITFITRPVDEKKLAGFYRQVKPGGPGWKRVREEIGCIDGDAEPLSRLLVNWLMGIMLVYAALFSIGRLIFKSYIQGFILLAVTVFLFIVIAWRLKEKN
jgi:hypothetical protein